MSQEADGGEQGARHNATSDRTTTGEDGQDERVGQEERRRRIERERDLGPLTGVEDFAVFRRLWVKLKDTQEGRSYIVQWGMIAVTRGWIDFDKFDAIWDATAKVEYEQSETE